jgi:hypothetical protein
MKNACATAKPRNGLRRGSRRDSGSCRNMERRPAFTPVVDSVVIIPLKKREPSQLENLCWLTSRRDLVAHASCSSSAVSFRSWTSKHIWLDVPPASLQDCEPETRCEQLPLSDKATEGRIQPRPTLEERLDKCLQLSEGGIQPALILSPLGTAIYKKT